MLCEESAGLGSAIWTRLTTPRVAAGSRPASVSNAESGRESTRPRPNVGVVRRPAKIVAPGAGFASVPDWQFRPPTLKPPSPNSWRSEPPVLASGSNTPLVSVP
jgi:hypothetical protein